MSNSVEVTGTQQVVVTEVTANVVEVAAPAVPAVVQVTTVGPQGPALSSLNDIGDVDTSAKVNQSVLYYDSATGMWLGNDVNTVITITDGGNF